MFESLQKVGWAADAHGTMVQDMGVVHGCFDVLVPWHFLDSVKVMSALRQM